MRPVTWYELALRGLPWSAAAVPPPQARERGSLVGLDGVRLTIHAPDALPGGIDATRTTLQRDVEERLREAGIPLLTADDWLQRPGRPELRLTLRAIRQDPGLYALSVQLEVIQEVRLEADPSRRVPAVTWSASAGPGLAGQYEVRRALDEATRLVAIFAEQYRSANRAP